jgi:hypothetical protein
MRGSACAGGRGAAVGLLEDRDLLGEHEDGLVELLDRLHEACEVVALVGDGDRASASAVAGCAGGDEFAEFVEQLGVCRARKQMVGGGGAAGPAWPSDLTDVAASLKDVCVSAASGPSSSACRSSQRTLTIRPRWPECSSFPRGLARGWLTPGCERSGDTSTLAGLRVSA